MKACWAAWLSADATPTAGARCLGRAAYLSADLGAVAPRNPQTEEFGAAVRDAALGRPRKDRRLRAGLLYFRRSYLSCASIFWLYLSAFAQVIIFSRRQTVEFDDGSTDNQS